MNMIHGIRLSLVLILAGATYPALAQNQGRPGGRPGGQAVEGRLSGTILDAENDEPIVSATVAVWAERDSSLVTGAVTKDDGTFEVDGLRGGQFYVKLSFIGYVTETVSDVAIQPGASEVDLGTIRLGTDARMMDEVEVSAERDFMEVQIDRTVYNTKDQLTSIGGTASDVLGNIPSVEVDIDGNLSLRGSQNVAVLLNGKPAPMQGQSLVSFLQGLPADAVERIEVIPNPSAKYEPDGMSGILNIVLKQNQNLGFGGGLSLSAATQESYNASGNVSFQKGPVNVFANYGFRYGTRDGEGTRYREDFTANPSSYPILDQDSFDDNSRLSNTLNTSIDYSLSQQNTLSLSGLWSYRSGDEAGLTSYFGRTADEAFLDRFNRRTDGNGTDFNMDYRLSFRRIIAPQKHELTAEVRYEQEWEDDFERFTQIAFPSMEATEGTVTGQERNDQEDRNRETSAQVDYIRPLGEGVRLEAGYKGTLENLNSDFFADVLDPATDVFVPDASRNNTFVYDQQVHAGYGIVAAEIGKIGLQGGVRLEQAFTDFTLETAGEETVGETYENDYFSIFPSAFATYKFSDMRSVKLSYSKRINRPSTGGWFNQLNPFNTNEDPFFRRVGNPYLKPEYIHAFEGSFTQLLGTTTLTLTPYFRRTVDVIRFIETIDDAGVTTLTFENLDTSDSWGAEMIGSLRLGQWLNAYLSGNLFKVVTDGSNIDSDLSNNAIGFSARANATVNVRPGLDLQLSYFYSAPQDIESGRISGRQMADVALRQQFWNDKASLSLRAQDVFGTMGFHLQRTTDRFAQEVDRTFNAQQVGLTFTYNFGQSNRNNRRNRGEGQSDENVGGDVGGVPMQ